MKWNYVPSRITLLLSSVNIRYSYHQVSPNQLWSKQQYRESPTLQSFSACSYHLYKMKPPGASFKIILIITMVILLLKSPCGGLSLVHIVFLFIIVVNLCMCIWMYKYISVNMFSSGTNLSTCSVQSLFTGSEGGVLCV